MLLGGVAGYSIIHNHIDIQAVNVREVQQALTHASHNNLLVLYAFFIFSTSFRSHGKFHS